MMVAVPLFESILSDDATSERSRRVAARVVQAALDDLVRIEKLDDSLAPEDPAQFDRRTAELLRGEYDDGPVRPSRCWSGSMLSATRRICRRR